MEISDEFLSFGISPLNYKIFAKVKDREILEHSLRVYEINQEDDESYYIGNQTDSFYAQMAINRAFDEGIAFSSINLHNQARFLLSKGINFNIIMRYLHKIHTKLLKNSCRYLPDAISILSDGLDYDTVILTIRDLPQYLDIEDYYHVISREFGKRYRKKRSINDDIWWADKFIRNLKLAMQNIKNTLMIIYGNNCIIER